MPIYEYHCTKCNHEMEEIQKMSDPVLTDCPEFLSSNPVKQVTSAGFELKGTGWYETDFKNSGTKPPTSTKAQEKTSSVKS